MSTAHSSRILPTTMQVRDATVGPLSATFDVSGCATSMISYGTPSASATLWLVALALLSQVIGWLLIGNALPKLPVVETSVLLLGQPVFAVVWGRLLFTERLSALQWMGAAIVLCGVAALTVGGSAPTRAGGD